jgi:type IV pilus assembly protein PilB
MFPDHNAAIADILKQSYKLSAEQFESIVAEQERSGKSMAETAIDLGSIASGDLLKEVSSYLDWPYQPVLPASISEELKGLVADRLAHMYGVLPYQEAGYELKLLAVDPFNNSVVEDLSIALNRDITLVVGDPAGIRNLIEEVYGKETTSVEDALDAVKQIAGQEGEQVDLESMAEEAPVIRFVNLVLQQAIRDKASDIHFEPFDDVFRIRYRVDGSLYEMSPSPVNLALPVISRVKVLANLNIAEQRVPQDGRIRITLDARPIDLRVSTLPTQYGESVVLRVLDKTVVNLDLEKLGMPESVLKGTRELIQRPNGVFVVTGPTGSGKTTTLYSCLKISNRNEDKILTAEDPIEYEIDGIMQLAVNPAIGLSFAHALRSFLRQDPDILMVGEIRDLETASIAVQAAQTGHLVLTTLHTNDAPGAITRLIDMGMESYLIASSLEAVLAQRLVRTLCPSCKKPYTPDSSILESLYAKKALGSKTFYQAGSCTECHQLGYSGRKGLFELMMIEDTLRELILERAPAMDIKKRALELGMTTLRQAGIESIEAGMTTVEEVMNYT